MVLSTVDSLWPFAGRLRLHSSFIAASHVALAGRLSKFIGRFRAEECIAAQDTAPSNITTGYSSQRVLTQAGRRPGQASPGSLDRGSFISLQFFFIASAIFLSFSLKLFLAGISVHDFPLKKAFDLAHSILDLARVRGFGILYRVR